MHFLRKLTVKNFRCLRQESSIDLQQLTLMVGANNAGKTAFLAALRCYFDDRAFRSSDLNKTEFAAKQAGFNVSELEIEFDLTVVEGKARKKRLIEKHGERLAVRKIITYREASDTLTFEYRIGKVRYEYFDRIADEDLKAVLRAVSISYIHPQEGGELLAKAQEKFKQRLFHNWGRHASVSDQLKVLQKQWDDLRKTANTYLSAALTDRVKNFWPGSSTVIDLPERIEDIVAVSDISFRSSPSLPEVTLTSQGTGAQSVVLYQTHYLLDSDRTLHQGFYVPIWLLEEPESFLHGDIALKLGNLLASSEWLANIQIFVSTHSPIILASSRQSPNEAAWVIMDAHKVSRQRKVSEVTDDDVASIAKLMGDTNFDAYFAASEVGKLFFLEDKRPLTKQKFEEAGFKVAKALDGTSEVKRYLEVFRSIEGFAAKTAVFLLDNDKGIKDFGNYLSAGSKVKSRDNFDLHQVAKSAFIILMPKGLAFEDLFKEYEVILEDCISKIYDENYNLLDAIPTGLSRAASSARRKAKDILNLDQAKELLRNEQDIKDIFWEKVSSDNLKVSSAKSAAIRFLIDATDS